MTFHFNLQSLPPRDNDPNKSPRIVLSLRADDDAGVFDLTHAQAKELGHELLSAGRNMWAVTIRSSTGRVLIRTTASKARTKEQVEVWARKKFARFGEEGRILEVK